MANKMKYVVGRMLPTGWEVYTYTHGLEAAYAAARRIDKEQGMKCSFVVERKAIDNRTLE